MFDLNKFVLNTIKKMIDFVPDYKVMQYSLTYYEKEILKDSDMIEIQELLEQEENNEELTEPIPETIP